MTTQAFTLPSSITIETIETLLGDLNKLSLSGNGLTVDAAQVEIITTPGVQVMLALGKSFAHLGGKLTISQPSSAFTQAFTALGLGVQLTEWSNGNA